MFQEFKVTEHRWPERNKHTHHNVFFFRSEKVGGVTRFMCSHCFRDSMGVSDVVNP